MGGNDSGSSSATQPYDLLGGQYASFSGGTPSGYNYQNLYSGIGQGLQQGGAAYGQMAQTPIPQFGNPNLPMTGGAPYGQIQQQTIGQPDPQLMDALSRILGMFSSGGGY